MAGEILFHTTDGEVGQMRLNAVVPNEKETFPARLIGKAQQALQLNFFKMANDPTATVVNVVILLVTNLGRMTEEDFHAAPEGMKLEEKTQTPSANDPFADSPLRAVPDAPNASVAI